MSVLFLVLGFFLGSVYVVNCSTWSVVSKYHLPVQDPSPCPSTTSQPEYHLSDRVPLSVSESPDRYPYGNHYSLMFSDRSDRIPSNQQRGKYQCMEDWGIVCQEDSQCCSGSCLGPFCRVVGVGGFKKPEKKTGEGKKQMRRSPPETMVFFGGRGRTPSNQQRGKYQCMEDWGIVCRKDSDCCSGSCVRPFCQVIGLPNFKQPTTTKRPASRTTKRPLRN